MTISIIILGFLLVIVAGINTAYFIKRRLETKMEAQLYLIMQFIFFILTGVNYIYIGFTGDDNDWVRFSIATALVFFLLASGLVLHNQKKWARFLGLFGLIFNIVFMILGLLGVYATLQIELEMLTLISSLSGIIAFIALVVLGIILYRTRFSPIAGIFIGISILFIQVGIQMIIGDRIEELDIILVITMNILMYLGFRGKLSFFSKKKSED